MFIQSIPRNSWYITCQGEFVVCIFWRITTKNLQLLQQVSFCVCLFLFICGLVCYFKQIPRKLNNRIGCVGGGVKLWVVYIISFIYCWELNNSLVAVKCSVICLNGWNLFHSDITKTKFGLELLQVALFHLLPLWFANRKSVWWFIFHFLINGYYVQQIVPFSKMLYFSHFLLFK